MARSYLGYDIYFPAFQDFRGRVYRTGLFNLHECDFYRSLLIFKVEGCSSKKLPLSDIPAAIKVATAKRYDSLFKGDEEAIKWFDKWYSVLASSDKNIDDYIIESMKRAKDPFQFMRKALLVFKGGCYEAEPVFMDASCSAYQIMAYLLQDTKLASCTNLIMSDKRIDLYISMRELYLTSFKESKLLAPELEFLFTRKLVKSLVMPLTYGKTIKAMADDIHNVLGKYISFKNSMKLAMECHKIWRSKFAGVYNMFKLFGCVGGLCSSLSRGVKLSTPIFHSFQDYRKFKKPSVWIQSYNKSKGKYTRHKISFNVLTPFRNVRKSKCATFANFIHQKDALVALNMVQQFFNLYGDSPMYTVHDCFVSNYLLSDKLADLYKHSLFESLGHPIRLVNIFITKNLIEPLYPNYMCMTSDSHIFIEFIQLDCCDIDIFIESDSSNYWDPNKATQGRHIPKGFHSIDDPIPVEHLKFFIGKWKQKIPKSADQKVFEERALDMIGFYNSFVFSLCGKTIDNVRGNSDYAKDILYQRENLFTKMNSFRQICESKLMGKKNYSLT